MSYLARAHFVKRDESKCLRKHCAGEITFREYDRDEEGAESELRNEGYGFEMELAAFMGAAGG